MTGAGLIGAALAMKQTSILFLPFVALAIARRRGRFLVTAAITSLALVVPFLVWIQVRSSRT